MKILPRNNVTIVEEDTQVFENGSVYINIMVYGCDLSGYNWLHYINGKFIEVLGEYTKYYTPKQVKILHRVASRVWISYTRSI